MITDRLVKTALRQLDALGYELDRRGITNRVNRHNIAAFLMHQQHHLQGEWESLQTRLERRRGQAQALLRPLSRRLTPSRKPGPPQ